MLKVTVDGRFKKALEDLIPSAIQSGAVTVGKSIITIYAEDPVGFIEGQLDDCFPDWRNNTEAHRYKPGKVFTPQLMLLRVWHLALRELERKEPSYNRIEAPAQSNEPEPRMTLAELYRVPENWLCQIPLTDTPDVYFYDGAAPTERYVRRPERVLRDGVRCGKCSVHIEREDRAKHAVTHGLHVNDIVWTRLTRFRRE